MMSAQAVMWSSVPVKVAHELITQEGLAAPWQANEDDDELLPVHPLSSDGVAQGVFWVRNGSLFATISADILIILIITCWENHVAEVDMGAVLWHGIQVPRPVCAITFRLVYFSPAISAGMPAGRRNR